MIRFYQSAVQVVDGYRRPVALVGVSPKAWISYNEEKTLAVIMAEVTDLQSQTIIDSAGVEVTRQEAAAIFQFPADFLDLPSY